MSASPGAGRAGFSKVGIVSETVRQRMEALIDELEGHDHRYYRLGQPTIPDAEYDRRLQELQDIEAEHPALRRDDSPTRRLGDPPPLSALPARRHGRPMSSLQEARDEDGFRAFARQRRAASGPQPWCARVRLEGVVVNLQYRQGLLQHAASRGDGREGEDITANVRTVRDVPLRLSGESVPGLVEVHGVIFVGDRGFEQMARYQQARRAGDADRFANPRSAAQRSLFLPDSRETAHRALSFFAHGVGVLQGAGEDLQTHDARLQWLRGMGLPVEPNSRVLPDDEAACAWFAQLERLRPRLGYEVDGVVFQVDTLGAQGARDEEAIVWRYPASEVQTEVLDIGVRVHPGSGLLIPQVSLRPAWLAGRRVDQVSLDSEQEVQDRDIRIGDRVLLRWADGAPEVVRVLGRAEPFVMAARCPSCNFEVLRKPDMVEVWCGGFLRCPAQQAQRIAHFASRPAMDIEGLGSELAAQLVYGRYVRDPADLYALDASSLECCLPRVNKPSIDALMKALKRSRETTLVRFLLALGLPEVGEATARTLVENLGELEAIMAADEQRLQEIDDIGPIVAAHIQAFFASPLNRALIQRLRDEGVRWPAVVARRHSALSGKTLVLTGNLSSWSRPQAAEALRALGARVTSSLSAKTDYLICGQSPGSAKLSKAKSLGIACVQEEELRRMIEQHDPGAEPS